MTKADLAQAEFIERRIFSIRGHNVIIDSDLAKLYGVETKRLNEQIKRNRKRFPEDFVFQLSQEEFDHLRSQSATSSDSHGGRRYPPYAFTEHGAIMAANVLRLEDKVGKHDEALRSIIAAIRQLMTPAPRTAEIGFESGDKTK